MRATKSLASVLLAGLVLVAGCRDAEHPTSAASPTLDARLGISDAPREGNPHFYWLPPMVAAPDSFGGIFDPSLQPTVRVCELEGTRCARAVAEFAFGRGSDAVRVSAADEHYIVNWHTKSYALDASRTYRIAVAAADSSGRLVELGYADVDVVRSQREMVTVETGRYIGLVRGTTLPIKFRIEEGATSPFVVHRVLDPAVVNFNLTPSSNFLFSQPTDGGEVARFFGSRDSAGRPSSVAGFIVSHPANLDEYDLFMRRDDGSPWFLELRDGNKVTYEALGGDSVRLVFSFPNGGVYEHIVDVSAQPIATRQVAAAKTQQRTSPVLAISADVENQQPIDVMVEAKYGSIAGPVEDAVVVAQWKLSEYLQPGEGAHATADYTWLPQSTQAGRYRGLLPIDTKIIGESSARDFCNGVNSVMADTCDAAGSLGYVVTLVCGALEKSPRLSPQQLAAALLCTRIAAAVAIPCAINDFCQLHNNHVSLFIPNGTLTVVARAHHHTRPGKPATVSGVYRPIYPPIELTATLPPWVEEFRTRSGPGGVPGNYRIELKTRPRKAGIPVQVWVNGSDAWLRRVEDGFTRDDGLFHVMVPAPEIPGVTDLVSGMVGTPQDVELFPMTLKQISRSF